MKIRTALIIATLAWLSTLNPQLSASPLGTAFTYQGKLADAGNPANGIYDLRFTIYDALADGDAVGGPLTNAAVAVSNGLFTVPLDFGAGAFSGEARWLEIGVRTNGSTHDFTLLSPRQPLTPAPQALYASSAGSVAASNLLGTLPDARLSTNVALLNTGPTFTGTLSAGGFSGNGAALTNLDVTAVGPAGTFTTSRVFTLAPSPGLGTVPREVAVADVNRDGAPDLISANDVDNTLSVVLNNGSGGFALAAAPSVGNQPESVTTADVNRDGWPDLISANRADSTLTVLTNDGSGGFAPAASPTVGTSPTCVRAADVNGDGWADLISADFDAATLTVLSNNRSGGFDLASAPMVGTGPWSFATADVNQDGWVDLVSANYNDMALTVLTNDGRGGFAMASSLPGGNGLFEVTAADVNRDGWPDLICAIAYENTVRVFTNDGRGGFVLACSLFSPGPYHVADDDVNGDAWVDLISGSEDSTTLTVLTNNRSGGFAQAFSLQAGGPANDVAAADVNGDGWTDLISANSPNTLSILLNQQGVQANLHSVVAATISGNGSGLWNVNANLLDGLDSTSFASVGHNHYGATWSGSASKGLSLQTDNSGSGAAAVHGRQGAGAGLSGPPASGVSGESRDGYGVLGASLYSAGVYGVGTALSGTSYGVYGKTDSTSGRGVLGYAAASIGGTCGLFGQSDSTSGFGVYGFANAESGINYGVYGKSDSTSGCGVFGFAAASSGATVAVSGRSESTSGYGVFGYANAESGTNYGVYGKSDSLAGVGVYGYGDTAGGAALKAGGSGIIQSAADTYLFVPAAGLVKNTSDTTRFSPEQTGSVNVYRGATSGGKYVYLPITLPAVLYGQPVTVKELTVSYQCQNGANCYIDGTILMTSGYGGSTFLVQDYTARTNETYTTYTLTTGNYALSASDGILCLTLAIAFANDTQCVKIGGARLRLSHQ